MKKKKNILKKRTLQYRNIVESRHYSQFRNRLVQKLDPALRNKNLDPDSFLFFNTKCSNPDLDPYFVSSFSIFLSTATSGSYGLYQRGWIYTRAFSLNRPYANQGSRPSLICVQISWYTERTVGVYLFCIYVLCIAIIPKPKLCIFFIFWVLFWNLRPRKPPISYTISLYYVPN